MTQATYRLRRGGSNDPDGNREWGGSPARTFSRAGHRLYLLLADRRLGAVVGGARQAQGHDEHRDAAISQLSPRDSRGRSRLGLLQGDWSDPGRAAPYRSRRAERRDGDAIGIPRAHPHGDRLARYADPRCRAGSRPWSGMADVAGGPRRPGAQRRDRDQVGQGGEDRQRSGRRCPPCLVFRGECAAWPYAARTAVRYPDGPGGGTARRQAQGIAAGGTDRQPARSGRPVDAKPRATDRHRTRRAHATGPGGAGGDRRECRRAGVRGTGCRCT